MLLIIALTTLIIIFKHCIILIFTLFFTGDKMIKLCARLVSLDYPGSRALLSSSILKLNKYSNKECSSKVSSDYINIDYGTRKEFTNPEVMSILESVRQFGFEESEMKILMNSQPELMKKTSNSWQNVVEILLQADLDKNDIFTVLQMWPDILCLKKDDLQKKMVAWMELGLGNDLLCKILTTHPHLLNTDVGYLKKRIKQYQLQFESKRRVGKLLLLAPNALDENWTIICDKLNYLNDLCTDNSDIVSSGVLAHSLFHIKVRHEFLIRAGIYKRPPKDFIKKLNKNPKLEKIVNTSDDEFVSKIAGLSLFEYNVFLEMFEEECDSSLEETDSDDETLMNKLSYRKHNKKNK